MKTQSLFSEINKNYIIDLASVWFAHRVIQIRVHFDFVYFLLLFFIIISGKIRSDISCNFTVSYGLLRRQFT